MKCYNIMRFIKEFIILSSLRIGVCSLKEKERYKRSIIFVIALVIMGIQVGLFAYIWERFYNYEDIIKMLYFRRGNWAVVGLYGILIFIFGKIYGAFKVGRQRVFDILLSQMISVVLVNSITYIQLALIGRWKWMANIYPMIVMTLIDFVIITIWAISARYIYTKLYPPYQMLMVYGKHNPMGLKEKVSVRDDKYFIKEMVSIYDYSEKKLKKKLDEYKVVMVGDIPSHERNLIIKHCFDKEIRCYTVPKLSDIMIKNSDDIYMFDTPLLLFRNRGLTLEQVVIKRFMDIVISFIGLIIAAPIMLIIAILVKSYDGGSIFYKQVRLTKDAKEFTIYKFRSMRMNSEVKGARLSSKNDSRVTPVGKVIRNIHFDELPQLFNIIKGDMSIVGPRPERPGITEEYEEEISEFDYRLKVKAGLTGYAQVYGKYNTLPYDKLKLDITYIEKYSLILDLKLMFLTFKILFQKDSTEGVEEGQTTAKVKKEN